MRRYLVVANQTLGGSHLLDHVRELMMKGPCRFHLVVPASHPSDHTWSDGEVRALAHARLDQALTRFRSVGADVTGEVGDVSPLRAISDALLNQQFDEIILSTLPAGPSRWLKQDLPHRVQRSFDLPLTHLVAETQQVS